MEEKKPGWKSLAAVVAWCLLVATPFLLVWALEAWTKDSKEAPSVVEGVLRLLLLTGAAWLWVWRGENVMQACRQGGVWVFITLMVALAAFLALLVWLPFGPAHPRREDRVVSVREGGFRFLGLALIRSRKGSLRLDGRVENKTSENWEEAEFRVDLFDQQGNRIRSESLSMFDMKRGEVKDIDDSQGGLGFEDSPVSRYEIRFKGGEYPPTHYSFVMVKPEESKDARYEDELIEIGLRVERKQIYFFLRNKSSMPMAIDWGSVSYADVLGRDHRVTAVDIVSQRIWFSAVPPAGEIVGSFHPADSNPPHLFPSGPDAKAYEGLSFGVSLPVQVGGRWKNYPFTFKIEKVEVEK
jgi:hypothetical protein